MPKFDLLNDPSTEKKQAVTLTVTQDCNLRCRYCYEPHKSRDYYMSFDVAKQAVIHAMAEKNEFEVVEVDFFGGEPMLAFDLIRKLVDWFHTQEWEKGHLFFIGTNGTILTDEMRSWLVEHKNCVICGISLDGNKIAHDLNRSNSYDQVKKNLPFFMEHWPYQPVKMTISAETIPYVADSIIELEEMGIPFTANVVFENIWGTSEQKAALLEIYAKQLDRLVDYYVFHPELVPARVVDVRPEFLSDERLVHEVGRDCVRWCGAGHEMDVIEVDGQHSPCHRFSPWITGRPAPTEPVNSQKEWKPDICAKCRLRLVCPTCAGHNWQENGDSALRTTYHCDSFKLEAQASAKLQALRLLQTKPEDLLKLPHDKAYEMKLRLDALLDMAENGFGE